MKRTHLAVHVINALKCGFDGVMGVVYSAEDCKLEKGRAVAVRNLSVLKDVLKKMNLPDRFARVDGIATRQAQFEGEVICRTLSGKPVHGTLAFH